MAPHPYLDGPYPRAYAHRGWHVDELTGLENTLAAFRRAAAEGFSYVELDVRLAADGVVVVHHDALLDRTTDASGPLSARTSGELASVLVRGQEPVPQLREVLTELPDLRVTIELKSGAVVEPVLVLLDELDAWPRVCVGGFTESWLARARAGGGARLCTSMAYGSALALRGRAWLDRLPGPLGRLPSPAAHGTLAQLPHRWGPLPVVDAAFLATAHAGGREVHCWTIDTAEEMVELLDAGVDGLLSDRPDVLRAVLRQRGQWPAG